MKHAVTITYPQPLVLAETIEVDALCTEFAIALAKREATHPALLQHCVFTVRAVRADSYATPYVDSGFGPDGSFDRMPRITEVA